MTSTRLHNIEITRKETHDSLLTLRKAAFVIASGHEFFFGHEHPRLTLATDWLMQCNIRGFSNLVPHAKTI